LESIAYSNARKSFRINNLQTIARYVCDKTLPILPQVEENKGFSRRRRILPGFCQPKASARLKGGNMSVNAKGSQSVPLAQRSDSALMDPTNFPDRFVRDSTGNVVNVIDYASTRQAIHDYHYAIGLFLRYGDYSLSALTADLLDLVRAESQR